MHQPSENNLNGSLEAKLEALFQEAMENAFKAALAAVSSNALALRVKEPIAEDALYSPSQAASVCSVSEDTIYRARVSGNLNAVQIGGNARYWGRDLKAWIDAGGKTGRNLGDVDQSKAAARKQLPKGGLEPRQVVPVSD